MHTLQQKYAQAVYEKIESRRGKYPKESLKRKQYGSMAHKFPVLVRQAGLIQALAFVHTRGKDGHQALLADLAQVIAEGDAQEFVKQCREADLTNYMWLTRQTLSALEWFKRFAQSVLEVEPGADEEG
ncbi:MAG: type III-B CRISPR module-associated protein Cmr5 [Chloroflexota bacterium]|nr:type III-B CRISPR module-associated protein Cmr5 [Chloroflexota bacterium]